MNLKKSRTAIEQVEWMRNLLALLLVGGFVGMIPAFMLRSIPEGNEQLITYMLGQLSGMALTALSFYYVNKVGQDALDATRADNTGKMADLAATALKANTGDAVEQAADEVAEAAVDKAGEIKGNKT